jgi:hypothetical protein
MARTDPNGAKGSRPGDHPACLGDNPVGGQEFLYGREGLGTSGGRDDARGAGDPGRLEDGAAAGPGADRLGVPPRFVDQAQHPGIETIGSAHSPGLRVAGAGGIRSRLAQQLFGTPQTGTWSRPAAMPADAYRNGDEFVIAFDLPGVDADAMDIDVERNVLTVRAERRPVNLGDQASPS